MKYAEYCQYIEYAKMSVKEMEEECRKRPIKRWAYLVHDKDTDPATGNLKAPHIHIMMELNSDNTYETVSGWFKDQPQYVERGKSKVKTYENMCSYLIHETPTKDGDYHYDPKDVTANFDFVAFIEKIREEVKSASSLTRVSKDPLKPIIMKIANNEIPRIKIYQFVDDYTLTKRRKDIDTAYKIRDEKIATKEINRDMNVVYISGEAGSGKTTLAKMMADEMGYSIFVSGSSNDPLEGYMGQECIILDDVRGSDWKINDLLKILDNNTNSLAKSRYSNKMMNDCKIIFITSVESINDLYKGLKDQGVNEPIKQLKRRCQTWIVCTKDTVRKYTYNDKYDKYDMVGMPAPNPVALMDFVVNNEEVLNAFERILTRSKNEQIKKIGGADSNTTPASDHIDQEDVPF